VILNFVAKVIPAGVVQEFPLARTVISFCEVPPPVNVVKLKLPFPLVVNTAPAAPSELGRVKVTLPAEVGALKPT
jgi:hypothetical protein